MKRVLVLASVAILVAGCAHPLRGQGRHDRKVAESDRPKNVAGGVTFQVNDAYDNSYDIALNYLKRGGHTIDSADKDVGQIITAIEITGGYSQTGTRIQVTLIKDSDTQTSVRVAVTKQKRKKALQAEPWSDPKVDDAESTTVADALKMAIQSK
ncbi:MAG: hypothetical protein ACLQBJ_02730 [Bryobacteraceae bacterium]